MKLLDNNDTICAISTPAGESGIGVVRLSGKEALSIADKIFLPRNGKTVSQMPGYTVHYGHIVRNAKKNTRYAIRDARCEIIDEVLLTIMRAPKSYTREDVVEISGHGGITPLRGILDLTVSEGARLARPGEFTKRAFLNGRIDLAQAEAVLDIITARTESSLRVAKRQLGGELSKHINETGNELLEILSNIEASLDFPDEEIDLLHESEIHKKLKKCILKLKDLLDDYENGKILRQGITTVICGKPNVGKSTLMNRFLKQKRVIVTPIPGTTRDAIEEIVNVKGIPVNIVDTAGIMHAADEISRESISRSRDYMDSADLILLVLDSSDKLTKEDIDIIDTVKDKKVLFIINKTDLPESLQINKIKEHLHNKKIIRMSAQKDKNLDKLYNAISDMVYSGKVDASNEPIMANVRHAQIIKGALTHLEIVDSGFKNTGKELLALDLKGAIEKIGLITGKTFTDDLLDEIFSRFCIGK